MSKLIHAAAAVAVISFAAPASAAILTATYTGVVEGTRNELAMFGGGNLDGQAFTATFRYDTSLGERLSHPAGEDLYGCTDAVSCTVTATQPLINASLTIKGVTEIYTGPFTFSTLFSITDIATYHDLRKQDESEMVRLELSLFHDAPGSVDATFDVDTPDVDHFWNSGVFEYSGLDGGGATSGVTALSLRSSHLEIAAVPEPGTWSLMIAGFGLVGAALRRRSVTV